MKKAAAHNLAGINRQARSRFCGGPPGLSIARSHCKSATGQIKSISLHQPWASLIACGYKQYETRHWTTNYRGKIAIHAAKNFIYIPQLLQLLGKKDKLEFPLGAIVAIADLTDCILMDREFINLQSDTEKRCGDWQIGRYAWKLENVRAIEPIPQRGYQGLWNWEVPNE